MAASFGLLGFWRSERRATGRRPGTRHVAEEWNQAQAMCDELRAGQALRSAARVQNKSRRCQPSRAVAHLVAEDGGILFYLHEINGYRGHVRNHDSPEI